MGHTQHMSARFALVVVALLAAGLLAGCDVNFSPRGPGGGANATSVADDPGIVVPVETATPERGDIATYFETTSRVEAERKVDIAAKATARCTDTYVDVGDRVETGQVIAELETDEAKAQYEQTAVQVRQNKTAYELAEKQFEEGLGPKVEMDNARYAYEQSLATLDAQKIQLENLTIRAPINGIITSRDIQTGMLVSAGQKAFGIVDPSSFILTISPPEKELPRLEVGQRAKVTIDSVRGREFEASIRRINPSVDPVSGTVKVVLDFDEDVRQKLRESAFARVKLVMATLHNVLLVPKEAVVEEEGRQYLFVVRPEDGPDAQSADEAKEAVEARMQEPAKEYPEPAMVAERIEVRTGLDDSSRVQILGKISDNDLIVTNGQHTLKSGTRVRVTNLHDAIRAKDDLTADEALAAAEARRAAGEGEDEPRRGFGGPH